MISEKIIVAKRDNIDAEGELINEEAFGYLISEHMPQVSSIDDKGQIVTGVVARVGVMWNHKRCPSPSYEDPSELYWLEFESDQDDTDDTDELDGEDFLPEAEQGQQANSLEV